ncbi:response regulator MprA [bacterium BMS3Abin07]|nr:response regulator MprA [bacterium BMS3Abin07]GBE33176.1 response regulator MprA [bacterium BMS3Bbin05]HDL19756.1 response regulator [Nitrospirota bacterium]HDO23000.1 response regulator [Nitrospirota bacterium]HDZ87606.1 response regulator [Nitrospirota bacterium]
MIIKCPKCKIKLNVPDEKISPQGTRFKCPKCSAVLLVKKPVRKPVELDKNKILIAVADDDISARMVSLVKSDGFNVITSSDGVDAMVRAVKELPHTAIFDVGLPKIYGFEVCKRLKMRSETKEMKVLLFTSVYDRNRYKRQPTSLYGADDYIEEQEIEELLLKKVQALVTGKIADGKTVHKTGEDVSAPADRTSADSAVAGGLAPGDDEWINKAKRLARIVMSDVFVYNPQKAEDVLRSGNFFSVFKSEIEEGRKLYENRIPQDIRDREDFFGHELQSFLENKKKDLNI